MTDQSTNKLGRREFLGVAAAAGFMIVKPQAVRGTTANSQVRFGLLGCGGRGTYVASGFVENAGARVTALADIFADRLEKGHVHFDGIQQAKGYAPIDTSQLFKGPNAYQEIAQSKEVDFILITTPPYFHTHHLETVVAAGKHVYCEKPVAVDVPGAHHVIKIGEKAQGKLSLDVGFQIRMAPPMMEITRRIHEGALGKIGSGLAYYFCGQINGREWPNASPDAQRLRNWLWDHKLSGDIIVEQNIHVIDMCNWMLKGHPLKAEGMCGRKVRTDTGDCKDNFNILFTYPDDVQISFSSVQFGRPVFDVAVQLHGTEGSSESHYDTRVNITGKNSWDAGLGAPAGGTGFSVTGKFKGALSEADSEKQKAFVASITSGQFHNQAALGAESALSAMLGRTAAYTGKPMTWDALQKSKEVYDPRIDLTKIE
jgi:myo-inositol 2-dehydrogenase / D-chiro-inositol 1-dehydrogenase